MPKRLGSTQKKILIILLGATSMAFTYSPFRQYKIMGEIVRELKKVKKENLKRSLNSLCDAGLVIKKVDKNGEIIFSLTKKGLNSIQKECIDEIVIKKSKKWDGKWRVVVFDIPENLRSARDSIRNYLNKIGFIKLQNSVFVYPLDCFDILSKIVEVYNVQDFIHFIVADSIDKEDKFKDYFKGIIA